MKQEHYDTVLFGIRAQGGPAIVPGHAQCLLRAPGGQKCAFGHLIPDAEYNSEWEGAPASSDAFYDFFDRHPDLDQIDVQNLQDIHDNASSEPDFFVSFERGMKDFADDNNLVYTEPVA